MVLIKATRAILTTSRFMTSQHLFLFDFKLKLALKVDVDDLKWNEKVMAPL